MSEKNQPGSGKRKLRTPIDGKFDPDKYLVSVRVEDLVSRLVVSGKNAKGEVCVPQQDVERGDSTNPEFCFAYADLLHSDKVKLKKGEKCMLSIIAGNGFETQDSDPHDIVVTVDEELAGILETRSAPGSAHPFPLHVRQSGRRTSTPSPAPKVDPTSKPAPTGTEAAPASSELKKAGLEEEITALRNASSAIYKKAEDIFTMQEKVRQFASAELAEQTGHVRNDIGGARNDFSKQIGEVKDQISALASKKPEPTSQVQPSSVAYPAGDRNIVNEERSNWGSIFAGFGVPLGILGLILLSGFLILGFIWFGQAIVTSIHEMSNTRQAAYVMVKEINAAAVAIPATTAAPAVAPSPTPSPTPSPARTTTPTPTPTQLPPGKPLGSAERFQRTWEVDTSQQPSPTEKKSVVQFACLETTQAPVVVFVQPEQPFQLSAPMTPDWMLQPQNQATQAECAPASQVVMPNVQYAQNQEPCQQNNQDCSQGSNRGGGGGGSFLSIAASLGFQIGGRSDNSGAYTQQDSNNYSAPRAPAQRQCAQPQRPCIRNNGYTWPTWAVQGGSNSVYGNPRVTQNRRNR